MALTRRQFVTLAVGTVALAACRRGIEPTPVPGSAQAFTVADEPGLLLLPDVPVRGVVLWYHGVQESETGIRDTTRSSALVARLVSDGLVVASHRGRGDAWGNPDAVATYLEVVAELDRRYPSAPLVHMSFSMGGLAGLSVVASGAPCAAWVGIQPVCSLASMADTDFGEQITEVYGGAPPVTSDPIRFDPARFTGVPMRFYASPDDRLVSKAENADVMAELVRDTAATADVVECEGDHNHRSHFQPDDVMSFVGPLLG